MKILMDIVEVQNATSLSASTIRRGVADGSIPSPVKVGTRILWRVTDLNKWSETLGDRPAKKETRGRKRMAV